IGQEDKRKARDTHTPTHGLASTTCVLWSACTRLGTILDNKMTWFTRSKALLRSKNTNPTSLLLSIAFSQLSVRLNKAVSQVAALCVIFQHRAEGFVIDICPAKKRIALEQKSV
ncbi:unnamed protein product, partial [Porites lobata]